ncbi:RidA family protein [Nodosilinea sp. LEGE 07088]|uniref:RidA family protein n=1 Tax=Nodosilinea sp. LEGE 07088 TaxID=2777968 RepID=UPI001880840F|nr:RidA family protein [Nodosilinea sp. LEGE 07088]MBE9138937.1 RidA family protein [Nodosilinea sp. LEGE 07088]
MIQQRAFSGNPWEDKVGYCRALRAGQHIFVSGTSPSDGEGGTFAPGDAYAQTHRCFEIIQQALEDLGADLGDVVRTRIYVTDMSRWEDVARAHHELFADRPPVNTTVAVAALANADMLVEIEADALCAGNPAPAPIPLSPSTILGRPIQPAAFPPVTAADLDEGCLD